MRITSIAAYHVRMPLISPWRTAYGEDAEIESVLVRMESEGTAAWGETSPLSAPCYSGEWAGGVFAVIQKWLAPSLLGKNIQSGQQLQQELAHFKDNPFAKAALDTAWWSLQATHQGQPLHRLLGATRDAIDVGADFGVSDSMDDQIDQIGQAFQQGFKRVKLKFRPGWDEPMLRAVRQVYPDQTIHIDCNSGYRLSDIQLFARLDDFNLAMFEQPLPHDDLVDHAKLQREVTTPVCLDESINSVARARMAIELGSCRYMNIKPGRVGGLTPAVEIHNLCQEAGIPCWVGGMLESSVGSRICLALATLDNFTYPADIFPTSRFYETDLSDPPLELTWNEDGSPQAVASDAPGIGAEPNPERLKAWTVQEFRIG